MRVGEEPHVEQQVWVASRPVLEAEALERDRQPPRGARRQQLVGELAAQHRRGQTGRVDHDVRPATQRPQELALAGDAVGDAALGRERVAPARLLVARQQRLLVGVEEQHPMGDAGRPEVVEHRGQALEVAAAADVGDDRRVLHLRARVHEQVHERADHLRGQVVHAEVALVLERGHRGRLAGAREPGDDHQIDEGRAFLRRYLYLLVDLIHA